MGDKIGEVSSSDYCDPAFSLITSFHQRGQGMSKKQRGQKEGTEDLLGLICPVEAKRLLLSLNLESRWGGSSADLCNSNGGIKFQRT